MAGKAIMAVTCELIVSMLHLPEGTRILRAREHPDTFGDVLRDVQFIVEADSISETPEGELLPTVRPALRTEYTDDGKPLLNQTFIGWNEKRQ